MTIKQPKQIVNSIYKKYAIIEENVIYADKLFIINTVINYIFRDNDRRAMSKKLLEYGEIITRYLNNDVDIYWEDDKLLVKELVEGERSTSGE
jgi:hypothetical protein